MGACSDLVEAGQIGDQSKVRNAARMRGSEHNDPFVPRPDRPWGIGTEGNHHGGMLGGISSGETIVTRVAIKPTSSIPRAQKTVGQDLQPGEIQVKGRHDPCLLPRFIPMGEAMMAIVLMDHFLRFRAQCGTKGPHNGISF